MWSKVLCGLPPDLGVPGAEHDGEPRLDGHLGQVRLQGGVQLEGEVQPAQGQFSVDSSSGLMSVLC